MYLMESQITDPWRQRQGSLNFYRAFAEMGIENLVAAHPRSASGNILSIRQQ
jgi:hypothetical protein